MTEDELVAAIAQLLAAPRGSKIVLGIGDDAAAWRPSRSNLSVITTDALIENVHFTREHLSYEQIGHRALASNLSDIAAMGARPVLATVALGLPATIAKEDVLSIYRGMDALARRTQTVIAGGDLVQSPQLMLSVTVVGEVRASNLKRRRGRTGDVLAVTGLLGASRAGFDLQQHPSVLSDELALEAKTKHATPEPRLSEGRWLAASRSVHAIMDLSDGISSDVARMAQQSESAAELHGLPIAGSARAMASALGQDPLEYAASAGEDFELLVAIAPRAFRHLSERFRARFGRPLYEIGRLNEGTGVSLRNGQSLVSLQATGWDHFRGSDTQ